MGKYFTKKFYPRNYILAGEDSDDLMATCHEIAGEAATQFPDEFRGLSMLFPFELRYAAPFEKDFCELKRLQTEAAYKAGFRDEFKGYIIIDVSDYLGHEDENYFIISLKFLHDMNEHWKYLFVIHSENLKAAEAAARRIAEIVGRCGVLMQVGTKQDNRIFLNRIWKEYKVVPSAELKRFMHKLLEDGKVTREAVEEIIYGLTGTQREGCTTGMTELSELARHESSAIPYLLPQEVMAELISAKEGDHNEKI